MCPYLIFRQKNSGVVEVSKDGKNFEFVRIFHLPLTGDNPLFFFNIHKLWDLPFAFLSFQG